MLPRPLLCCTTFSKQSTALNKGGFFVKKIYHSPDAKRIAFSFEEILSPSQENPILTPDEDKTPSKPATEFGDINIF